MSLFDTKHKKKAVIQTFIVMSLLFLSFFLVGLTYLDPPPELGVEVNFGTSNYGSGRIQPLTNISRVSSNVQNRPQETSVNQSQQTIQAQTQNLEDVSVVASHDRKANKKINHTNKLDKPKQKAEPKPDQSTSNALNNILGAPSTVNSASSGHGNDGVSGDKGQIDGNPYANAFFGGGYGNGAGFGLNGRKKQSNGEFKQECDEEGRVVVRIKVNRQGLVVEATPGVKGTTNSAKCLQDAAQKTAKSYRFNADPKAPAIQIGFVVVKFSLK